MKKLKFTKSKSVQYLLFFLGLLSVSFLSSCGSEYEQMVKKEMNSGVRHDSLIFGMSMGQTKKDFFAICWDLNKAKVIGAGTGNQYARYEEPWDSISDITQRIQYDFYGIFDKDQVMQGMEMIYSYSSWAPWNTERHSDILIEVLKKRFVEQYGGNEFMAIERKKLGPALVKVDGNRQIIMSLKGKKDVLVRFEDLHYKLSI